MNSKRKIITGLTPLKRIVSHLRRQGKTIAFTNGCFDILHLGHVRYLESAKKPNRILIVAINSDSSVRRIKGRKRPIISQNQRAGVIAALHCVDYVTIFSQATPYRLIKALEPDVLIKGADWKTRDVVGSDVVRSYGGKVELIKYLNGFSTTNILKSIVLKCAK